MKKIHYLLLTFAAIILMACNETDTTWDPYHNWAERNAEWYRQVADTARTAIRQAKAQHGNKWEDHCEWRMYKSLLKAQDHDTQLLTDTVCVRILSRGPHAGDPAYMPHYTDSVRISYRGWLMQTDYENEEGQLRPQQQVFSQTYYGPFNPQTAAPSMMAVSSGIEGYSTALQYMTPDDDWLVYIPQQLAYGATAKGTIPAYSTLLFRIHLVASYAPGTDVPSWLVAAKK